MCLVGLTVDRGPKELLAHFVDCCNMLRSHERVVDRVARRRRVILYVPVNRSNLIKAPILLYFYLEQNSNEN